MTLSYFVVDGVFWGSHLFLLSFGFFLVHRTLGFFNIAHGEFAALGGYVFFVALTGTSKILESFLISIVFTGFFLMAVERLIFKPLRSFPGEALLLTSFGLSIVIRSLIIMLFSGRSRGLGQADPVLHLPGLGPLFGSDLAAFFLAVILVIAGEFFLRFSRLGLGAIAIGDNLRWAVIHRLPIERILAVTFFISGATAALGGALVALRWTLETSYFTYTIYAFVVTMVAGNSLAILFLYSIGLGVIISIANKLIPYPLIGETAAIFAIIAIGLQMLAKRRRQSFKQTGRT